MPSTTAKSAADGLTQMECHMSPTGGVKAYGTTLNGAAAPPRKVWPPMPEGRAVTSHMSDDVAPPPNANPKPGSTVPPMTELHVQVLRKWHVCGVAPADTTQRSAFPTENP